MRRAPSVAVLPVLVLAAVAAGQEPPTPPVFRREVEIVKVDVVVTDKAGTPVRGLEREDFTVLEEGQPQTVQSFEVINAEPASSPSAPGSPAPPPPPRARVATNFGPEPAPGRTFVIVFDNLNLSPLNAQRAKGAALAFLDKGLRDGDRVMLAATGGGAWWSTRMPEGRADLVEVLKGLDPRKFPESAYDRMTDFEAMRVYQYSDSQVARRVQDRFERYSVRARSEDDKEREGRDLVTPGRIDLYVDNKAAETYLKVRTRNRATFAALERVLRPLEASRDRKAVVFMSEGFVYDPAEAGYRRVVEAARRANAALYFVDTRGLADLPGFYSAQFGGRIDENNVLSAIADTTQDAEGAVSLARDTGGFSISSTNDLESGVVRIGNESSCYYLLGYAPGNVPHDGRFRRIEVKVRRAGVIVRARRGYFAPSDVPTPETDPAKDHTDPQIQAGLDAPAPIDGIPLRLTAYVLESIAANRARVLVAGDADVSRVDFKDTSGKLLGSLDTVAVVARRENAEFFRNDQKVDLERKPGPAVAPSWYTMVRDFELPAGGYQAKLVVRDPLSRRVGTVTLLFDVPPLDALRITSPILSDTVQFPPNAAPAVVLLARRTFRTDRPLFCRFDVSGAQKGPGGLPRVSAGHVLRRADGTVVGRGAPTDVAPTSIGAISRLMQIPLNALAPGDYELALDVRDEVAGRGTSSVEPFTLVAADGR
ncbi:MAG TPA: VWA domain-containing protein [Vicinamibacteria bacterium]|nr:VWA domain-containing protein [Vicinamibacteria bacterium]